MPKSRNAIEFKKAIEALEAMNKYCKFYINTMSKGTASPIWQIKVMEKKFRGADFVVVAREAVLFAAQAHNILKEELPKPSQP